jgi:hypothetical protein
MIVEIAGDTRGTERLSPGGAAHSMRATGHGPWRVVQPLLDGRPCRPPDLGPESHLLRRLTRLSGPGGMLV